MSWIECPVCGAFRSIEKVWTPEGFPNPPCANCGDPGWLQPLDAEDPLAGRGDR